MKLRRNFLYRIKSDFAFRPTYRIKQLAAVGFIMLIIIGISIVIMRITTIKKIETEGINAVVSIDPNKLPYNLLFFPTQKVKQLLLSEYTFLSDVKIEKKYPSTLRLIMIPRNPVAKLVTPERSVLVAEDGTVLFDSNSDNYPVVQTSSLSVSLGSRIERKDIVNALAFIAQMPQDEDIQSVTIDNAGVLRVTLPAFLVVLSQTRDGRESARTLQSVLTGFRIKGSVPKIIDLRFDQPVITW
jgi:cell division septal protein FtsQ